MKEIVNSAAYADGKRIADVDIFDVSHVLKEENQFVWIGLQEIAFDTLIRAFGRK